MNPLTGICPTHRVTRGYRHASPHGERLPSENEGYRSDAPQPTANYSLLTANSYFASGGGLQEIDMVEEGQSELIVSHQERFVELFNNLAACLDADFHSAEDMLKSLYKWQNVKKVETDCYWYHPDHLGSSSWITDSAGTAVQHLHYLPWGENFVNQKTTSFSSMYTFSAKEKDTETGYSYFGSRYYNSDLSIWLSVDPMSDKYPSLSPYVYCADNPVKLVDPDGEEVSVFGDSENKNTIINSLNAHFDNITVGYDKENPNKLVIVRGTAQTEDEIAFAAALKNTKIDVNLQLVDGRKTGYRTSTGEDLEIEGAGAFLGNYISYSSGIQTKENIAKVHTLQYLSVGEMKSLYKEKDWGQLINHEITESFQGGVISSEKNIPGRDDNWNINSNIYREAHASATPQPFTIGASWFHH